MLVNGNGIRAIGRVLKASTGCVLRTLVKTGELLNIRPLKKTLSQSSNRRALEFCGQQG